MSLSSFDCALYFSLSQKLSETAIFLPLNEKLMTIDKIKAERITSATRQFGRMMCNYQSAFARAAPLNYLRFARNPKLRVASIRYCVSLWRNLTLNSN